MVGVAVDGARGRVGGAGVDLRQPQRCTVGHAVVPGGMHQPYGVVRCQAVQVRSVQIAQLRQLALVPAVAQQPFTGLHRRHLLLHQRANFGDAGGLAQVQMVELVHTAIGEVPVRIDQPGSGRLAMKVDDPGPLRGHGENVGAGTHTQDSAIANGDSLCDRIVRIDRKDPSVHQHHIGCGLFCLAPRAYRAEHQAGQRDHQQ
jgi:hypothetical protein